MAPIYSKDDVSPVKPRADRRSSPTKLPRTPQRQSTQRWAPYVPPTPTTSSSGDHRRHQGQQSNVEVLESITLAVENAGTREERIAFLRSAVNRIRESLVRFKVSPEDIRPAGANTQDDFDTDWIVEDGHNTGTSILEQFFGPIKHLQPGYQPLTGTTTVTTRKFLANVKIVLPLNNDVSAEALQQRVDSFENICAGIGHAITEFNDDARKRNFKLKHPLKNPSTDEYSEANWNAIADLVNSLNLVGLRQMQTYLRSWNDTPLVLSQVYDSMHILSMELEGDQGLFWYTACKMRMPDSVKKESSNMAEVYDFILKVIHYTLFLRMGIALMEDPDNDLVSEQHISTKVLDITFDRTRGVVNKDEVMTPMQSSDNTNGNATTHDDSSNRHAKTSRVSQEQLDAAIRLVKRFQGESRMAWLVASRMGFTSIFMLPPKMVSRLWKLGSLRTEFIIEKIREHFLPCLEAYEGIGEALIVHFLEGKEVRAYPEGQIKLVPKISQMGDLAEVIERKLKISPKDLSFDETIAYIEQFFHKERSKSAANMKVMSGLGA